MEDEDALALKWDFEPPLASGDTRAVVEEWPPYPIFSGLVPDADLVLTDVQDELGFVIAQNSMSIQVDAALLDRLGGQRAAYCR